VFAPPVQAQPVAPVQQAPQSVSLQQSSNDPALIVLNFGKHNGKSLGWIKDNDATYLAFLKGNKKELAEPIDRLLSMVQARPPQQMTMPSNGGGNGHTMDAETHAKLLREVQEKIMSVPEFQGPGIVNNAKPWIQSIIGVTALSDAPVDQLFKLKAALDQRIAGA
jgi:hypothetical protein